ncbi:MAG: TAXI family TRAP transporter solute-binding subunit [Hyphomicrobiaceae bacterium]
MTCCGLLFGLPAAAQTAQPQTNIYAKFRDDINKNVVTIISSEPKGGFVFSAHDIAAVFERKTDMRVIPMVGQGGAQNVKDVLYLRGVDMGIMHPHVIKYYDQNGLIGPEVAKRIAYITLLFTDELHVVVRPEIKSFDDLRGKRINFSNNGSSTQIAMRLIFKAMKMKVEELNMGQADAFEMMKRGELDATTCACSKPLRSVRTPLTGSGFKFLTVPHTNELKDVFLPGSLTSSDYPELIPAGQNIDTIAIQTILGVYNWKSTTTPRYRKISDFVRTFFDNVEEFGKRPRQPQWRPIDVAANIKGLQRFGPAQDWLAKRATTVATKLKPASGTPSAQRQAASAAPSSPADQAKLFRQFLNWVKQQPQRQ